MCKRMRLMGMLTTTLFLFLISGGGALVAAGEKAIGVAEAVRGLPDTLKTPNRYALVVGVGEYTDSRIPKLPAGANDAKRLYAVLTDPAIGLFPRENVELLVDRDVVRWKVVDALDALGRKAGKDDLVVVYFSGHGAVDERGRSYWVMHNTQIDSLRATALSETEITELVEEIKTRRLVTLIDACYSAATVELGRSKSLIDLQAIYPQFTGDGRVAITASKGDQLSVVISDGNHPGYGHSAFTWHVVEGMSGKADRDQDGVVAVDEVWSYVKDKTETTARQQGGNQQPQLKGQIGSKFLLTVDSERLVANSREVRQSLESLKRLFLAERINAGQYEEARRLLTMGEKTLDAQQRARRKVYVDLAGGRLAPEYLRAALDAIETPAQRAARLERAAKEQAERERQAAERQRRQRMAELLAKARANDSRANARVALTALEELLRLDPGNAEALSLRVRIRSYLVKPGDVMTNSIGMDFVWVAAGEFMMGSASSPEEVAAKYGGPADSFKDEHPRHRVRISQGFWLSRYEVTKGQFEQFVRATGHRTTAEKEGTGYGLTKEGWKPVDGLSWRSPGFEQSAEHPVVQVSW